MVRMPEFMKIARLESFLNGLKKVCRNGAEQKRVLTTTIFEYKILMYIVCTGVRICMKAHGVRAY